MAGKTKYRNVKSGGFDSKKESKRASKLKLMELAGEISDLKTQVWFELIPSQRIDGKLVERACSYVADFVYKDKDGKTVVEDTKSSMTQKLPLYIVKRKLMLHVHGIKIVEV